MRRHDNKIGVDCVRFHDQHRLDPLIAHFGMLDIDPAIKQEYFDFLAKADAYTDSHGKVIHQAPQSKDLATDEFLK